MAAVRTAFTHIVLLSLVTCSSAATDSGVSDEQVGGGNGGSSSTSGIGIGGADQGGGGSSSSPPQILPSTGHIDTNCPTSVSGTVYSPAKSQPDPLYNAIVFVPQGKPDAFQSGATCDQCGVLNTAKAVSTTLTNSAGKFQLAGIDSGDNVPLVIQIGRWRRQVTIPHVAACTNTELPAELTRMPRNQQEGDIPLMAIASGWADPTECLLRKMGIDEAEFTIPGGTGRIHIYESDGANAGAGATNADALFASVDALKKYDMVLLPCEGFPDSKNPPTARPDPAGPNLLAYLNAGGRVFATHFSDYWFATGPNPLPKTATWGRTLPPITDNLTAKVDTSFPKGAALAEWLQNVGASQTKGEIDIKQARHNVDGPNAPAQRWIYSDSPTSLQHFTFNTPFDGDPNASCGRAVYSNFHIASRTSQGSTRPPPTTFPKECDSDMTLDAQEKVLEFMLFDLASCVQPDKREPTPPR